MELVCREATGESQETPMPASNCQESPEMDPSARNEGRGEEDMVGWGTSPPLLLKTGCSASNSELAASGQHHIQKQRVQGDGSVSKVHAMQE